MASRLVWRPLVGGVAWTGVGIGAGWTGLALHSALGGSFIYSTSIVTASFWCGTFLVLLPLGVTRGVIQSVQEICHIHGRPALQQALDQAGAASGTSSTSFLSTPQGNQQLLERLTLGSGWQGRLIRSVASPFLPSTTQMMVRLQELADKANKPDPNNPTGSLLADSRVLVTAADGFIEGFLQDKKDTITTLGLLGYAGIVGLGLGVDYSYKRASEWKQTHQQQPTNNGGSSESEVASKSNKDAPAIDFQSIQKRLGLQSRGRHELEHQVGSERQESSPITTTTTTQPTKEVSPEKPRSIRETFDAAQIQVGEMIQIMVESTKQADPYFHQALEVAGNVTEEMAKQGGQLIEQAKQVLLDEKSQQQFQERWKSMTESIKNLSPDDDTVRRISQEMEEALRQAKKRLNEEDVQEMRRDLENAIDQAGKRIAEERKKAKVDEKLEQVSYGIRYRLFQWWRGRGGE